MAEVVTVRPVLRGVFAIGLSCAAAVSSFAQQDRVGFSVLNGRGHVAMAAALSDRPFRSGVMPSVGADLNPAKPVPGKDGQWLSSVGFYGWSAGGQIRIALVGELHPSSAGTASAGPSRDVVLATYDMAVGETRTLDELKPLGLDLVSVRIDRAFPQ